MSRLFFALLTLAFAASVAHAQEAPLVLVVNLPRYEGAAHRGLHPRAHSLEAFRCDPAERACLREYFATHATAQLLFVSVLYERRGCVPIRREGREVGSRMLQARVLTLRLYNHDGSLVRESHADIPTEADDRAFTTEQVRAFFASAT